MICRLIPVLVSLLLFAVGGMCPRPVSADRPEAGIGAGHILLRQADGHRTQALHLGSQVHFSVSGFVARVELTQRFTNQTDEWQEAVYVLPMSASAAVNEMEMRVGERLIRATIREKEQARRTYQAAKEAGRKAALVEQSRPNLFRQAIANIAPRESIEISIRYVDQVDYDAGSFSLRFPMTLTPRYIPAGTPPAEMGKEETLSPNTAGWAMRTAEVPDAHLITAPMSAAVINPIAISVSLDPGLPLAEIGSTYHRVSVKREADAYAVSLVDGEVPMDRDFELRWRPVVGSAPEAAIFRERLDGEDHVLLMVLPPARAAADRVLARDMIFIIDTSGSMRGTSIEQAKASLGRALGKLRPEDRFNVIEFNSSWRRLFKEPQFPDAYTMNVAQQWVARLSAGGGTNMLPALQAALQMGEEQAQLKHIVFITDGAVGNEGSLFQLVSEQLGDTRLFPVGIGSAPNSYFMRLAARHGRGTFTYIGSVSEVEVKMDELFRKIDAPVATDLHVEWPVSVESYPSKLPAVYQGEPLLIVGKARDLAGEVHINGSTAHLPWRRSLSLESTASRPGVGVLWARKKIEALEDERIRGRDADAVKEEIIGVGLAHQLVTRHTSLVAVEEIVSRLPVEQFATNAVPNRVAAGQVAMYPRTATGAPAYYIAGFLALLLLLLLRRRPVPW